VYPFLHYAQELRNRVLEITDMLELSIRGVPRMDCKGRIGKPEGQEAVASERVVLVYQGHPLDKRTL
jgi:hypothetical protein